MNLFLYSPTDILYQNNTEYRQWIRRIFHFTENKRTYYADLSAKEISENIDDESKDEMEFDEDTMQKGLDWIFEHTITDPIFEELYQLAAATMVSTDVKIGQAVLCCYDFFHLYYTCLWHFFKDKNSNQMILSKSYQRLILYFRK